MQKKSYWYTVVGVSLYEETFSMSFNKGLSGPLKKIVIEGFIIKPGIVVQRFHCLWEYFNAINPFRPEFLD